MRRHGTISRYAHNKCRCDDCRQAMTDYRKGLKQVRQLIMSASDHRHGTVNGYTNWACRCDACKAAWAEDARDRRKRPGAA